MARRLTWLDTLLSGIRKVFDGDGEQLPERPNIQFTGSAVTLTDDVANNRTVVTLTATPGVVSFLATAPLENTGTAEDVELELTGEISDANHGDRAGGALHANATTSVAGFMSGADKTKLDGVGAGAAVTAVSVTAPIGNSGTSTAPVVTWSPGADVSMSAHGFTSCTGVANGGGNVTIDASGTANVGTSSATATNTGHGTITNTITGVTDSIYNGFTTTKTLGRRLRQTTASDVSNTVRFSPSDDWEAHARVLGSDATFGLRFTLEPTTGGNLTARWERSTGSGYSDAFYFTTSSPGQFLPGFATTTLLALGSGGRLVFDADNSSLLLGASGELVLTARSASQPFVIRGAATASSTDAIRLWAFGETKAADETLIAVGDGTSWTERGKATADGVWDARELHDGGALKTAHFDAKANFTYIVDPSAGAIDVTLEAASTANKGKVVEVINFGTSTNTIRILDAGAANIIVSSIAASSYSYGVAGSVRRFKSMGGDGWLLICSVN